jgi:hypothetical protein
MANGTVSREPPVKRYTPQYDQEWEEERLKEERREKARQAKRRQRKRPSVLPPLILVAAIVLVIFYYPQIEEMLSGQNLMLRQYPLETDFMVRREISLTGSDFSYEVKVPMPEDMSTSDYDIQKVWSVVHSESAGSTYSTFVDIYNRTWMLWNASGATGTHLITITYRVSARTVVWELDQDDSGFIEDINQTKYARHLGDEWVIQPSDQEVKDLALEITRDHVTVYDKLKAIYDWMLDNIAYLAGSGEVKSCDQTLSSKVGDCDDQSVLFASMARSIGIPAKLQLGALYDSTTRDWIGHGWLNVYFPLKESGGGWVVIDMVNREFFLRDPYRMVEWDSIGNGDYMDEYYHPIKITWRGPRPDHSDGYISVSFQESDKKITVGGEGNKQIPGFEMMTVVSSVGIAAALKRRKKAKV